MEKKLDCRIEAVECLKEVEFAVRESYLSQKLESTTTCAYFNLTTNEESKFTVRLTQRGFEVSAADGGLEKSFN